MNSEKIDIKKPAKKKAIQSLPQRKFFELTEKQSKSDMKLSDIIFPEENLDSTNKFIENIKKADALKEDYRGNFVAIYEQKVVGVDIDFNSLKNKILKFMKEKELYITYLPKKEEIYFIDALST